jgi:GTP-binding protein
LIRVVEANFVKSASKIEQSPTVEIPEVAILGRSNVGKSSTINSLTERKGLAKSSNTPGKTKLINFFQVAFQEDDNKYIFSLVDLPGVGYAKVSKTQKKEWEAELLRFIGKRKISLFIYLIDSRHPDLEIDKGVVEYLHTISDMVLPVYTKTDKLKKSEFHKLKAKNRDSLLISNQKGDGVADLRKRVVESLFTENEN